MYQFYLKVLKIFHLHFIVFMQQILIDGLLCLVSMVGARKIVVKSDGLSALVKHRI